MPRPCTCEPSCLTLELVRDGTRIWLLGVVVAFGSWIAKETLGERVNILGHFYQRDEVVTYADFVGDSFNLAKAGAT